MVWIPLSDDGVLRERANLEELILPFTISIPLLDQWIIHFGKVLFISHVVAHISRLGDQLMLLLPIPTGGYSNL